MKITHSQLRQIVNEELLVLNEVRLRNQLRPQARGYKRRMSVKTKISKIGQSFKIKDLIDDETNGEVWHWNGIIWSVKPGIASCENNRRKYLAQLSLA